MPTGVYHAGVVVDGQHARVLEDQAILAADTLGQLAQVFERLELGLARDAQNARGLHGDRRGLEQLGRQAGPCGGGGFLLDVGHVGGGEREQVPGHALEAAIHAEAGDGRFDQVDRGGA
jgi:hypothetical protein